MSVPDYQSLMLHLLEATRDGKEHPITEIREAIAQSLGLTERDREELLPSGKQAVYNNRLGWAKTYLDKAGLLRSVRRGVYQITDRGRDLLAEQPARVDVVTLSRFQEFEEFRRRPDAPDDLEQSETSHKVPVTDQAETPQESLDSVYQQIRRGLESEILTAVRASSFRFFERLVVELLVKMGYGGSLKDAGRAIGRSGDDGLDGVIKEDHLGLDAIYVQAKRWENTVGRPHVQSFAGSLEGVRGRKGVFITTSTFSGEAREYVSRIEKKIVLIDGAQLAGLMIDFGNRRQHHQRLRGQEGRLGLFLRGLARLHERPASISARICSISPVGEPSSDSFSSGSSADPIAVSSFSIS
jgi:restriction system protein